MKQLVITTIAAALLVAGTSATGAGPLGQLAQAEGGDSVRVEAGISSASGGLRLNEILASNRAGRLDDEGQTSDWIEIHNPGASPMRLGGYRVTHRAGRHTAGLPSPAYYVSPL